MKYSPKGPPPQSFEQWLATANEDWTPVWGDLQNPQIGDVRAALLAEQEYVCSFCGRGLTANQNDSHIEHFRPRERYNAKNPPDLTLDYNNFSASCGSSQAPTLPRTCGQAKDNEFDEALAIAPWDAGCEVRFDYGLAGGVQASNIVDDGAAYMIRILALDHPALVNLRATLLAGFESDISSGAITAASVAGEIERLRGCCQSNDNLSPLRVGRAGGVKPSRRASSTQPGRLSVGPCMSLC